MSAEPESATLWSQKFRAAEVKRASVLTRLDECDSQPRRVPPSLESKVGSAVGFECKAHSHVTVIHLTHTHTNKVTPQDSMSPASCWKLNTSAGGCSNRVSNTQRGRLITYSAAAAAVAELDVLKHDAAAVVFPAASWARELALAVLRAACAHGFFLNRPLNCCLCCVKSSHNT